MGSTTTLEGKTVIVTGGAGGLGKVIASAYLVAGANVAICDVHEARLAETAAEFESTGRLLATKTDITDEDAVAAFVQSVVDKFGRLDVLVNNAGLADGFTPVGTTTKACWDTIIGVNLTGSFLAARAAVNAMEKNPAVDSSSSSGSSPPGGGLIIQIGSLAGQRGFESGLAYTVSKHGVNGIVKHTAAAYGPKGIYAVGLMVGSMPTTNIAENMGRFGGFDAEILGRTSSGSIRPEHFVDTADVAKYCLFLSDRSIAATANGSLIDFRKNFPVA